MTQAFDPKQGQRFTVGFLVKDDRAWDELWHELRTRFAYQSEKAPARAFAFSVGDMFDEQSFIDEVLNSALDDCDKLEAIAETPCADLAKLRAEWGIRDTDGSPEGRDGNRLDGEAEKPDE